MIYIVITSLKKGNSRRVWFEYYMEGILTEPEKADELASDLYHKQYPAPVEEVYVSVIPCHVGTVGTIFQPGFQFLDSKYFWRPNWTLQQQLQESANRNAVEKIPPVISGDAEIHFDGKHFESRNRP